MKTVTIDRDRLESILLNHLYPKGNITFLMKHTVVGLAVAPYDLDKGCITLKVHLDPDHWAFTKAEESKRYVVDVITDDKFHVRDAIENMVVGIFFNLSSAKAYARMKNKQ